MVSYTKVTNMEDTGDDTPDGGGSWKDFWEEEMAREFGDCSKKGCGNEAEHGSHVQDKSENMYIVPLCEGCNNPSKTEEFEVKSADLCKLK